MSLPIFAALCRRASPNTSRIRLLLGSVLLAASLNVAQASALLRKYIILEDALTHVDEAAAALKGGSVQERTKDLPHLIVLWTPSAGTREAPTSAEVYLGYRGSSSPVQAQVKIDVSGDHFTGEVTFPSANGYQGGSWRFSGPLAASGGRGQFTALGTGSQRQGRTQVWTVFDNGKLWMSRAWVPPGPEPVRGIFIFGNGQGNDERIAVIDNWWLTFCRLHRFALVATAFYGPNDARTLQNQISEVGRATGHPELDRAPVLFTGHSNGGEMAWEYNAAHPNRVIAFTVSKGGFYPTTHIDAAAMHNPAILIIGENDTSVRINAIMGLFAANRPDNAPWALAVEPNIAHGFGRTAHLWLPFLEWAVQARLPCAPAAPGDGSSPAGLAIIDPATGFVVAHRALKGGEEPIMPAASFKGSLDETSWLPNEMLAMAFLAFNTPKSDLDLTMEPASGVLHANDRLRLGIARFDPHAWKQVRLLVNGRVVASLSPEEPEVTIGVSRPGIYCAVAVGAPSAGGPLRLAGPLSWIVGPSDR